MEFKVFNARRGENTLEDTIHNALGQIEEKGTTRICWLAGFRRKRS